jgi:hypothetical protein
MPATPPTDPAVRAGASGARSPLHRALTSIGPEPPAALGDAASLLERAIAEASGGAWIVEPAARAARAPRTGAATADPRAAYSPSAALLLSAASAWAYSDAETLAAMLATCGMRDAEPTLFAVSNGALFVDTQAYLVRSLERRTAVLVFRGTEVGGVSAADLFTDVNTALAPFPGSPGAQVHSGFQRAFKYLWPRLEPALTSAMHDLDHLFVAGHSLGGALAVLATAQLFTQAPVAAPLRTKLRGVYTFGGPMVGDPDFAALCGGLFGDRTFRHVYGYDVVPRLPPRTVGRFAHFGAEYHGTRREAWAPRAAAVRQTLAAALAVPLAAVAFLAEQLPLGRRLPLPVSLGDHLPQNYVDCSKLPFPPTPYP